MNHDDVQSNKKVSGRVTPEKKLSDELQEISRTKEEFVAIASHQLRTPATAVKQYLGMLLQGYAGSVTALQMDMLQKAYESNERQIDIINQILDATRADMGKLTINKVDFDMCELIESVVAEQKPLIKSHGHRLKSEIPNVPIVYFGDKGYLRMVFENLLNNADKYTQPRGLISVKLSKSAGQIIVEVSDTGVGIAKDDIGKLFIKFSRIQNELSVKAGGSGVGLYIAQEIVKLHGGDIGVKSVLAKGSSFEVRLSDAKE